jgi:hypothetical protein
MSDDLEKKEEMSKEELVYVMSTMLDCTAFSKQINKLSKPCLFQLFDNMSQRRCSFSNIEDDVRKLERKNIELQGQADVLIKKNKMLENKLKQEVRRGSKRK